jgi:signal transduction histidine kinase
MLGVNLDITKQKHYEETLEQSLQQEKELNELKSRFISVASHEFRTPLSTILATTENLVAYRERMDSNQIDKRLEKIKEQVNHLKLIMDDVLLLSKMQSGRLEFHPTETDLDIFCQEIVEEFESSPDIHHQIVYSCTPKPLIAQFDLKLMRHILSNLLSNALKYSPKGKEVYFEVSLKEGQLNIQVKDKGIGIPEQDLKHLFEPFHRAGNIGTISGTGLGLAITKQSVETHGGTLELESMVGEGTTFIVTIPI